MKKIIRKIVEKIGYKIIKKNTYNYLIEAQKIQENFEFSQEFYPHDPLKLYLLFKINKSQIRQDVAAIAINNFKKNGFFVEFGATNGITLNNTYLLEKHYCWQGILAEPAKIWHKELENTRSCNIEKNCVWTASGEKLNFLEVEAGEFSTIKEYRNSDLNFKIRKKKKEYVVETISLNDLLEKYNAPQHIDYLSIDTEGSEYNIIEKINFNKYKFNFITIEHNYSENRDKILMLLNKNGYKRLNTKYSLWDDWYVNEKL
jgi:FkbM family methyltransferase